MQHHQSIYQKNFLEVAHFETVSIATFDASF